jgi:hypothetical protein
MPCGNHTQGAICKSFGHYRAYKPAPPPPCTETRAVLGHGLTIPSLGGLGLSSASSSSSSALSLAPRQEYMPLSSSSSDIDFSISLPLSLGFFTAMYSEVSAIKAKKMYKKMLYWNIKSKPLM